MKTQSKTKRYLLFYGTDENYGVIGNIENETFEGDYDSTADASLSMGFVQGKNPEIWAYIYDLKKKDYHSYTANFNG